MKTSWPRVEARITRRFSAEHSLPQVGNPELHEHDYEVVFGYCHEINPSLGYAKNSLAELIVEVDAVVNRVAGKNLNDVLPVTPTAEWLACWMIANIGCDETRRSWVWDFAIVRAYGCFEARADLRLIPGAWVARLRP